MLKVYLDKGQKSSADDEVMCLVATIFKPVKYKQFIRPWNRMLKRWDAPWFHATDFYNGAQGFERNTLQRKQWFEQDSKWIPRFVGQSITRLIAVAFRPQEFVAEAPNWWKENFGTDSHALGAQLCFVMNGLWLKEKYPSEKFAYVQETDPNESAITESARKMRTSTEYGSLVKIASFNTVDKGMARGLEASDFAAWHWDKHYIDRMKKGLRPRKDFQAFTGIIEDRRKVESAFITGEKLKLFFKIAEEGNRVRLDEGEDENTQSQASRGNA